MSKVLVACEFSGRVRDAFLAEGIDAVSCDIMSTQSPGPHLQCDVRDVNLTDYDLLIAFPPCTHLCVSGARWFAAKTKEQQEAVSFFYHLAWAKTLRIAVENPINIISKIWRRADQIIQPWQFGHPETKSTCLWLKNLPRLRPSWIKPEQERAENLTPSGQNKIGPGPDRWMIRSKTYHGVARAMARQWGWVLKNNWWPGNPIPKWGEEQFLIHRSLWD